MRPSSKESCLKYIKVNFSFRYVLRVRPRANIWRTWHSLCVGQFPLFRWDTIAYLLIISEFKLQSRWSWRIEWICVYGLRVHTIFVPVIKYLMVQKAITILTRIYKIVQLGLHHWNMSSVNESTSEVSRVTEWKIKMTTRVCEIDPTSQQRN